MEREELKELILEAVTQALANPANHCRYQISPEEHRLQHEALERFIQFTSRIDDLKWDVLKKLIAVVLISLFSLAMFGTAVKLKLFEIANVLPR